jgi:hypothetical protein
MGQQRSAGQVAQPLVAATHAARKPAGQNDADSGAGRTGLDHVSTP